MSPVWSAALIVFLEGLVLWATFPITYAYCKALGAPPERVGLYVGLAFMLLGGPKVLTNPVLGRWSDRWGRRPLMALSSLGTLISSVVWARAGSVAGLLVSRAIGGAFGAQATLAPAVVADSLPPERRGMGMGVLGAAFALSLVLGPLLGGLVAEHASHAAVGWLGAGLQLLSILTSLFVLRETRPMSGTVDRPRISTRELLALPRVSGLMASTFLATFGVAHFTTTFPAVAEERYGLSEAHAGYAFTLFGLVGVLVQGGPLRWLVPRFGERWTALTGLALLAVSLLAVAGIPPLALLWICAAAVGAGTALVTPTLTALVSGRVDYRRQGSLLGLHQSATALGRSIGAAIAGWVLGTAGPAAPYCLAAAACAVAGALLLMQGSEGSRD